MTQLRNGQEHQMRKNRKMASLTALLGVLAVPLTFGSAFALSCMHVQRAAEAAENRKVNPSRYPSKFYITDNRQATYVIEDADWDGTADYAYLRDRAERATHPFLFCREGITRADMEKHGREGVEIYVLDAEGSARLQKAYATAVKGAAFVEGLDDLRERKPTYKRNH